MNKLLSCIVAFFLVSCVWAAPASDPEPSPFISRLSLPDGATMRIGKGDINFIAYSPDSKRIAAASSIGVWIYDAGFGKEIALLRGHTSGFSSAAYSPDGKRIVSASRDGAIQVWDAASNRAEDALLYTLSQTAITAAYSPDSKTIAGGSYDGTIRIWNADDGALLNTLEGHTDDVRSVAYSPDGKTIASGSRDGTARIWDADTGDLLRILEENSSNVSGMYNIVSVAYSPDGKTIVSGNDKARIWDADTGDLLHILGETDGSVAYSPDGKLIAFDGLSESRKGTVSGITIWNAAYGSSSQPFTLDVGPNMVAFSPDGHNLAAGNFTGIYIWNIEIHERIHRISGHGSDVAYAMPTPDGSGIAVARYTEPLRIWDPKTGALLKEIPKADGKMGAFSPDGRLAADVDRFNDTIRIIDIETDSTIHALIGHTKEITAVAFSPDGKTLVSSSNDATVLLWNVKTGARLHMPAAHTGAIYSAAYSPDGRAIVTAAGDKTARIWNAETGQLLKTLDEHTGWVYSAAYSPDSKKIVTASRDETARIWNAETGQLLKTLGHTNEVLCAAYSPDGKTIASASDDLMVRIWSAETGELLKTLEGHTARIRWVRYLSDSKTLASASMDGTVLIWDASNLMGSGGDAPEGDQTD